MKYPVIIIGAGGHAKVLINALLLSSLEIIGLTDSNPEKHGTFLMDVPIIGDDGEIMRYPADSVRLVNGIGSVNIVLKRRQAYMRFKEQGYCFAEVVHPSAVVASDVVLSEGSQIMAGAVIQPGSSIGVGAIINTGASVDHDCRIGDHAHIAPGVTISGEVEVGENSHIGSGTVIIQGVKIGRECLVAAGSVVVRDVPNGAAVLGVPARERKR